MKRCASRSHILRSLFRLIKRRRFETGTVAFRTLASIWMSLARPPLTPVFGFPVLFSDPAIDADTPKAFSQLSGHLLRNLFILFAISVS